jgi:hypothetical protein
MDVVAVVEKFCAGWTSLDAEAFSRLFALEGYYRHSFRNNEARARSSTGTSSDVANRRARIRDVE